MIVISVISNIILILTGDLAGKYGVYSIKIDQNIGYINKSWESVCSVRLVR